MRTARLYKEKRSPRRRASPSSHHAWRVIRKSPITSASMRVRKKQSSASSGRQTIGSLSLNDVFNTTGTPVKSRNALISRQYRGFASRVTVCSRPVPSTCVGAGICARLSGRRATRQLFFRQFSNAAALAAHAAAANRRENLLRRKSRPPVSVFHHKRARLSQFLVPHVVSRPD